MGFFDRIYEKRQKNMTRVYRGVEFSLPQLPKEMVNDVTDKADAFSREHEQMAPEPEQKEYKIDEDLKCDYLFLVEKISELEKKHWYARWNFVSEVERGKMCSSEEKIKLIDHQLRTADGLLREQIQKIAEDSCPDEFISVGLCNEIEEAIKNGKDTFTVKG